MLYPKIDLKTAFVWNSVTREIQLERVFDNTNW
jgi:hypothetical protein